MYRRLTDHPPQPPASKMPKRKTTAQKKPVRAGQRKRASAKSPGAATAAEPQRLQKVLAAAGAGSRRQCEELITAGRVEVDRRVVTELGTRVDPARQEIRLDATALPTVRQAYYAVNKPSGVISTNRDPSGRPRVIDLVPPTTARLFTIGRLDAGSEGLILVTNDGELANRLTHPRYGVEKTYRVQVAGRPDRSILAQLRRGVRLADGVARVDGIRIKSHHKDSTILEMVLREGRNREIRRVLAKVGHKVIRLMRVAVGPVKLGELPSGASRLLTSREISALRRTSGKPVARKPAAGKPAARKPTAGKPAARKPTARKPTAGKPAAGKPAARKPTAGKPTARKSTAGKPAAGKTSKPRQRKKK